MYTAARFASPYTWKLQLFFLLFLSPTRFFFCPLVAQVIKEMLYKPVSGETFDDESGLITGGRKEADG